MDDLEWARSMLAKAQAEATEQAVRADRLERMVQRVVLLHGGEEGCSQCLEPSPCTTIRVMESVTGEGCICAHPADDHSIYGCHDDCPCEWMSTRVAK